MKEKSIEEDIERIAKLITTKFNNDYSIDNVDKEAIEELLKAYKELKEIEESHRKENGELRGKVKQLEEENKTLNERNQYLVKYRAKLEKELYESNENYIPVSLVEEKIEELNKKRRKFTSDNVNNFYLQEFTRKYTKKSDHDYGVFSTPETITYCTNNELLGRIEALQELLREE